LQHRHGYKILLSFVNIFQTNNKAMQITKILFYGVSGYTGQLILEAAAKAGLHATIAGRNAAKIKALATTFSLPYRIFGLDDAQELDRNLRDFELVLHCAGPFHFTTEPMLHACLRCGVHYLDLSGRVEGFELVHSFDAAARAAGIMLLSGVGFDVVPSDCLVARLHQRLPDATHLSLCVAMKNGGVSHGTAISSLENIPEGASIRKNGIIQQRPLAEEVRHVRFGEWHESLCALAPWGDVSTAFYTAQIPNIRCYLNTTERGAKAMRLSQSLRWWLKQSWVKSILAALIRLRPAGPDAAQRQLSESYFYAEVWNEKGEKRAAALKTSEAYTHTAEVAVSIVQQLAAGAIKTGFQTPSMVFDYGSAPFYTFVDL
jgi:short subunit dehydrogenase-like uncharacterized protein